MVLDTELADGPFFSRLAESGAMRGIFDHNEKLIAGAEVLQAVAAELKFTNKTELRFYRYSDKAWFLEYVASQSSRFKK